MASQSYQDTLASYTAQLRGLFEQPPGAEVDQLATRGGAAIEPGLLASRAERLADTSRSLGEMTSGYLEGEAQAVREAAELKLLAQANAEVEVAVALLQAAEDEARGAPAGPTRSGKTAAAARAVNELADVLEAPLEGGLASFVEPSVVRGTRATKIEDLKKALSDQVARSLKDILRQASGTSSLALDSLLKLDGALLGRAIAPVNQELADVLNRAAAGLGDKLEKLLQTAARLLLQAYDWVLTLIGKDAEAAARKRVKGWIDDLRTQKKPGDETPGLAEKLVASIYVPDDIKKDVGGWLKASQAGQDKLQKTTQAIGVLSANFEIKAKQTQKFIGAVGAVSPVAAGAVASLTVLNPPLVASLAAALPAIEAVRAAVLLGLMGYIVFTGYDHVDSGKAVFFERFSVNIPDRVEGVRETVQKALAPRTA